MKYAEVFYRGKKIFSGHFPKHDGKVTQMVCLLKKYGWCFPPVPVVDMGVYYQALDGSHRIEASRRAKRCPEIVVTEAKLHPDQPVPKGWEEIVNAPLAYGRTIRGFALQPNTREDHIGVVLDKDREILRVEYVENLFQLLLQVTRKVKIFEGKRNEEQRD